MTNWIFSHENKSITKIKISRYFLTEHFQFMVEYNKPNIHSGVKTKVGV